MIDDDLGTVPEIAELRFPKAKHVRIIERVTVIEPEDSSFGEETIINAEVPLFLRPNESSSAARPLAGRVG